MEGGSKMLVVNRRKQDGSISNVSNVSKISKISNISMIKESPSKKFSGSAVAPSSPPDSTDAQDKPKKPKNRLSLPVIDQPWTRVFPQDEDVDFETYLALKEEERKVIMHHHAATIIQAAWSGFLVRFNLRIVVDAITKIQSAFRGNRDRERCYVLDQERRERRIADRREKAAITIQSAWKGYWSRKTRLDYASWKKIQLKNEALRLSIERINELEALLLQSAEEAARDSVSTRKTSKKTSKKSQNPCEDSFSFEFDNLTPSLENMIIDKLPELVNEMSEDRIAELYTYLANLEMEINTEKRLERKVEKLGGIHNLNEEQIYRLEQSRMKQKERANLILDLAKMGMGGTLKEKYLPRQRDSVDEMFATVPERPDLVRPDLKKVEDLKRAIRMFRERHHKMEESELKKKHLLLRTFVKPGVLSDIYTTEPTDVEKRMKSMKFWKGSMIEDRRRQKEKARHAKGDRRLRRLFTYAMRLSEKESTPPSNNDGTADDEEGFDDLFGPTRSAEEEEYTEMSGEGEESMYHRNKEGFESEADSGTGVPEVRDYVLQPPTPLTPIPPPPTPTDTDREVLDLSSR